MPDLEPGTSQEVDAPSPERDVEDLSPSVRRLVRQFDVDVKSIRGSGPEGRVRASDVMAAIGGRASVDMPLDAGIDDPAEDRVETGADADRAAAETPAPPDRRAAATSVTAVTMTTVFECDMTRVLAHQKSAAGPKPSLTSYCVVAAACALEGRGSSDARETALGVVVYRDGLARRVVLADPAALPLAAIDAALVADDAPAAGKRPQLTIHHHGLTGSLIATPTPLAADEAASLGIGAVRRVVGVRTVNGEDAPRLVAQCLLSLTFRQDRIELAQASGLVARAVRVLEAWAPAGAP